MCVHSGKQTACVGHALCFVAGGGASQTILDVVAFGQRRGRARAQGIRGECEASEQTKHAAARHRVPMRDLEKMDGGTDYN